MAVPTIIELSPSSGLTRGLNVIQIIGTNFRLPGPVPSVGYLGGEQEKTVRVSFDGVESPWAYAASESLILAKVPTYTGPTNAIFPMSQAVRVSNIDANGVEIPGEYVVSVDAYTLTMSSLSEESYYQRVIREFLRLFKRHVTKSSFVTSSRDAASSDYSDKRQDADVPSVYLIGPRAMVNRFYSTNRTEIEVNPQNINEWIQTKEPVTLDFEFTVSAYANSSLQMYGLCQACILMFRDITVVRVPDFKGQDEPSKEYETEMIWQFMPETDNTPNSSDLFKSSAQVIIRGVNVDDAGGTIVRRGWRIHGNDGMPVIEIDLS